MKLIKILFCWCLICCSTETILAQNIAVDDTYTAQQLVENVLISSTCATVSNFAVSGGNFGTGEQSYGYFNAGSSGFPFPEGIVLSTSRAITTQGPNNSLLSEDAGNWFGDTDLEQALGISNTSDATILEFDFIPLTSQISFDYIFASEEYHDAAPCHYSDGFAFLLKEVGSASSYQNLALIPSTTIPVKVTTVHPLIAAGNGCPAQNEAYFGSYNPSVWPINFNGQTIVMTAKADVIPGTTYHIKLVIADETNPEYDSAIFLKGGSFSVGTDLGPDRLIATNNPICYGDTYTLDATESGTNSYKWFKDGAEIFGETNPIYTVTAPGIYKVEITINSTTCIATGEVTIEYVGAPTTPVTLVQCDDDNDGIATFNLTHLDTVITQVNTQVNTISYYENLSDAQNQLNQIANSTAYQSATANQLIARVSNVFGCLSYVVVNLQIANNPLPNVNPIVCDEDGTFDGITAIDLDQEVTPIILNGLPAGLLVEYYSNSNDAVLQTNPLPNPFTNTIANAQILFARIVNGPDCYGIIPVPLQIVAFNPPNFEHEDLHLCDSESLFIGVANGFSSYLWNTLETTSTISINTIGDYNVTVTNSVGCEATKTFSVTASSPPIITSIDINDFSGSNNTVQINVTGNGNYEYSLNGFYFQDSALFTNVPADEYFVIVRDKNGCNPEANDHIYVLDYPKYFTPNGDGIHDNWEIKNLRFYPNATIYIFDRFGKLIYNFNPNKDGWNGDLNQYKLLSDDYWFVINLGNGRNIKGHFAMKR